MTNKQIISKITEAKKGRFINFTKKKDLGNGVKKITDMVIRLGVNYSNLSINAEKETGSLPWGQWQPGLENLVITHSKLNKETGRMNKNYYLRITSKTPANPNSGADVVRTTYYKGRKKITREEAEQIVGAKKMESHAAAVYNVSFKNIIKIGK